MARPVHEIGRVLAVMDGELRTEPDALRIFAQQARADGVEGARPGGDGGRGGFGRKTARGDPLDPPIELGRGSPRESREHDAARISAATRCASIAVFPEPAPAMTRSARGPPG